MRKKKIKENQTIFSYQHSQGDLYSKLFFIRKPKKCSQAVAQSCSVKKVFLEISQNSWEKASARVSFLIKNLIESSERKT